MVERNIILVPLEEFEERYTSQWRKWFVKEMKPNIVMEGDYLTSSIEEGSFLDVCGTNYYKASQLQKIVNYIYYKKDESDMGEDVFFFMDLWFPGIEMLAYIRNGLDLKFQIMGCLHAGTYDPNDFTAKTGMNIWGADLENSWFKLIDKICVATHFHKRLIINNRDINPDKIIVTGFPIYDEYSDPAIEKENIIVFPHRMDSEKNPLAFRHLQEFVKFSYPDWKCVFSKETTNTKQEYYDLLNKSKIAVSFASQETWGIAMQEALFAGCLVLVPDRLSYSEMYHSDFQYNDMIEGLKLLRWMVTQPETFMYPLKLSQDILLASGRKAIPNMVKVINS